MQKEILKKVSGNDLLLDHTFRHRGAYAMYKDYPYVTNSLPLMSTLNKTVNPIKKDIIDDYYIPLNGKKLFKYPIDGYFALNTLVRVDANRYMFSINTITNDPILGTYFINYQSDFNCQLGYSGATLYIVVDAAYKNLPIFRTGQRLAVLIQDDVSSTALDRYGYFYINSTTDTDLGHRMQVTCEDDAQTPIAFSWANFMTGTAPSAGTSILFKCFPYQRLKVVEDTELNITTVASSNYNAILGAWLLTKENNTYYIYRENGTLSAYPTIAGSGGEVALDAVEYDLDLLEVGNDIAASLVFVSEGSIDRRAFVEYTKRNFYKTGVSFAVDGTISASEYILPSKERHRVTGFLSKDRDGIFATMPNGIPFLKLYDTSDKYLYNLSLGRGVVESRVVGGTTYYDTSLRKTEPATSNMPTGAIKLYKGQCCPAGWKEVVGLAGDSRVVGSGGTEIDYPKDAFFKLSQAAGSVTYDPLSVEYLSEQNVTKLSYTVIGEFDPDFCESNFYSWSVSYRDQEVKMLPRPAPESAYIKIGVGLFSIRIPIIGAPPLPKRKVRKVNVPYGERIMPWCPGVELFLAKTAAGQNMELAERLVMPVARIQISSNYEAAEVGLGTATYPSKYPTSLFGMFFATIDLLGTNTYAWAEKLLGSEALPGVTITATPTKKLSIYVVGNWYDRLRCFAATGVLPYVVPFRSYLVKTGHIKNTEDMSGQFDFGSQQHNHLVENLPDTQLKRMGFYVDSFNDSKPNHFWQMPPICTNHGHGYVGYGSYNRPTAVAVKVCEKI